MTEERVEGGEEGDGREWVPKKDLGIQRRSALATALAL